MEVLPLGSKNPCSFMREGSETSELCLLGKRTKQNQIKIQNKSQEQTDSTQTTPSLRSTRVETPALRPLVSEFQTPSSEGVMEFCHLRVSRQMLPL